MNHHSHKIFVAGGALLATLMFIGICIITVNAVSNANNNTAAANHIKFYQFANGIGANGYDVVAYFTDAKAAKGNAQYHATWGGMPWRFSSAANRDLFLKTPLRYIPQYGGHCAYGVSQGYLVAGDPLAWSVRNNKLYLNYNANIRTAWLAAAQQFILNAAPQWKKLNRQPAATPQTNNADN